MSQCHIPSLYVVNFKGRLNSGEAQVTSNPEVIHLAEKRAICRSADPRMVVQIEGVLVLGPTFQSAGSYGVGKRAWNGTNLFSRKVGK
jgi:hypothetical protein